LLGLYPADTDVKKTVARPKICGEAAKPLAPDSEIPKSPSRGVETFFDGVKFDPDDPTAYLKSLKIKSLIEGSGIKG